MVSFSRSNPTGYTESNRNVATYYLTEIRLKKSPINTKSSVIKNLKLETGVKKVNVLLNPRYKLYFNSEIIIKNKFSESNSTKTSGVFLTNRTYDLQREGK